MSACLKAYRSPRRRLARTAGGRRSRRRNGKASDKLVHSERLASRERRDRDAVALEERQLQQRRPCKQDRRVNLRAAKTVSTRMFGRARITRTTVVRSWFGS